VARLGVPALSALALAAVLSAGCQRAQAFETFTLEAHDRLIEGPGCYAECRPAGPRRQCTVREFDCKVICAAIPECRPDGPPAQVCAVVKARPM
jgi:hypothetical protein